MEAELKHPSAIFKHNYLYMYICSVKQKNEDMVHPFPSVTDIKPLFICLHDP